MKQPIIGIDEVGRGPLAGPVMVGAAMVPYGFDWSRLPQVTDSKQLTAEKRQHIYLLARQLRQAGEIDFAVARVSAAQIDTRGIVPSIQTALNQALVTVMKRHQLNPEEVTLLLDGGLRAPACYVQQQTIIKGDAKERVIGLASIVAKVTRDSYMCRLATKTPFTQYGFAKHKGYGTKQHRTAIAEFGLTAEHRRTFCRAFLRGQ